MDTLELQEIKKQTRIFMPYAMAKLDELRAAKRRLVHYSSAECVLSIISNKTIWMRNTRCMDDYAEVELGYLMIQKFFQKPAKKDAFFKAINACAPNLAEESIALFDQWWNEIRFNTYICSVSEHEDTEDAHGRLSMWRAFGQSTVRAAMVMRVPEDGAAAGLRLMLSPIAYFGEAQVERQMHQVLANVSDSSEYLKTLHRDHLKGLIFFMIASAVVSIKHEGFAEEKEWRVIYFPRANPSNLMKQEVKVLGGVPQLLYKIPLMDNPAEKVTGISVPALVDRVIIGPTMNATPVHQAFVQALMDAGMMDAATRVVASQIPLRS